MDRPANSGADKGLVAHLGLEPAPRGRPPAYDQELIENVLWEVAVHGGNVAKALRALREHETTRELEARQQGVTYTPRELPRDETVRRWLRVQYRNRYHEIVQGRGRDLEELRAQQATALAIRMAEVEESALRRVAAGVDNLDAVDAARVLKDVASAKKVQGEAVESVRRMTAVKEVAATLDGILANLQRLGVAQPVDEPIVDAEVVEAGKEGDPPSPTSDG